MIYDNIEKCINGGKYWLVGDFVPSILKTNKFEVGIHLHKKGENTLPHYHTKTSEINVILDGEMIVNGKELAKNDVFIYNPYEISYVQFIEDTKLLVIRDGSHPNDKYLV